ncbi:MAG: methionine gamma-lyase family protein, partial [Clostridia bacterium]
MDDNIFNISKKINDLSYQAENDLIDIYKGVDDICYINTLRILKCFKDNRVSTTHFNSSSGYGYDNIGREVIEKIYASIFDTEKALVRSQFINGTHAISTALFAILRNNDELLYITGTPYDTLHETIGITENSLSLKNLGVKYNQIELKNKVIDIDSVVDYIKNNKVKVIAMQRSKGYADRKTLSINYIKEVVCKIREVDNDVCILVDNCYGELTDICEPTSVGADICCGSLIKNIGGGLCETGAYIVGKEVYVDLCADRLNGPGMGYECGATLYQNRNILQGLFLAPNVVSSAIKSMIFASYMLDNYIPVYDETVI